MLQQDVTSANFYPDEGSLDPWQYVDVLRKRLWYLVIPFVLVLTAGAAVAWFWPPTYLSEGKILVESQQIPTDLVKPTVTASAKERLEVIQQRVMTRNNLLAILDKYNLYNEKRERLSRTELLDLMRDNTVITPIDVQRLGQKETIAMTVGFMDRRPDLATKVANDLITLFLNEDARTRTSRAAETTRFLAREVERLASDLSSVDRKIAEANLNLARARLDHRAPGAVDTTSTQLATLRAQLVERSAIFAPSHPEIRRLKAQIRALEKAASAAPEEPVAQQSGGSPPPAPVSTELLDALQKQRDFVQTSLDDASKKYAAAQMGEKLERDQFSERLQVLEQAVPPQKPIKPNRIKILGLSLGAALMAAFAGVFAIETFDRTIRGSRDLAGVIDSDLLMSIPYIQTRAETAKKRRRLFGLAILLLLVIATALAVVHFFVRPLDELWPILVERVTTAWSTF